MIMKALYFLIMFFCLAGCQSSSTKQYVIDKVNVDLAKAVRLIYMTDSDNSLDLSKCHPIDYFRTLTPPDDFGDMYECVAIRYQEGLLFSVDGSGAVYFFDNDKLKKQNGIFSAVPTKDNYWLPAVVTSDGQSAGYECVANETNSLYYIVGLEQQRLKLEDMGVKYNPFSLPLVETSK